MAHFPQLLRQLPKFDGPFDAYKLEAKNCDVLMASYPAGTNIAPHQHDTENVGVITQGELILTLHDRESRYGPGQVSRAGTGGARRALRAGNLGNRILVLRQARCHVSRAAQTLKGPRIS